MRRILCLTLSCLALAGCEPPAAPDAQAPTQFEGEALVAQIARAEAESARPLIGQDPFKSGVILLAARADGTTIIADIQLPLRLRDATPAQVQEFRTLSRQIFAQGICQGESRVFLGIGGQIRQRLFDVDRRLIDDTLITSCT